MDRTFVEPVPVVEVRIGKVHRMDFRTHSAANLLLQIASRGGGLWLEVGF